MTMKAKPFAPKFAVCVNNTDYPASLELWKIYPLVADAEATKHGQVRVIDESGEDYLYPNTYFVPMRLPKLVAEQWVSRSGFVAT
jgi:hypothetical protein